MRTNQLKKIVKRRKRLGRGIGTARGKTAGRGTKGQKSRSGYNIPKGFEGGQNPLKKRIPKLGGFKSKRTRFQAVNINLIIDRLDNKETVSSKTLLKSGLVGSSRKNIKIIGKHTNKSKAKKFKFSKEIEFSKNLLKTLK
jgi:large subunit ribosomal protein L15